MTAITPSNSNDARPRSREPIAKVESSTPVCNTPKLAIVITCYNYENYVEHAIQSARPSELDEFELVIIDDGSTDGSWDVIGRLGVTAFRIENGGARQACLFGLDQTRAPFVLFLDADDELKPGAIGEIISKLDPSVAKLQFALTRINGNGDVISGAIPSLETFRVREALERRVLKTGVYTSPPTSGNVFRRDVCEHLRDATYDKFIDGTILFAAPFMGDVVSLSDELGRYRIHDRNDSGLGRSLEAALIERDIHRFVQRMDHLRAIVKRLRPEYDLVKPQETYFFLERSFCLDIGSGRRPSPMQLPRLIGRLWQGYNPIKTKIVMTTFFVAATVLPNRWALPLLERRFNVGHRLSFGGFNVLDALKRRQSEA